MQEHKITVKAYMTKQATPEFDFMQKWNNNIPMPMRTMIGTIEKETRGMVYMKLHADITEKITHTCMKCGRPITNPVSQYFGMGPECGGHNYVNPFNSEAELANAVAEYRKRLRNITWEGWVIKSAIESNELLGTSGMMQPQQLPKPSVTITISGSNKCNGNQALYLTFMYDTELVNFIRSQPTRYWSNDDKAWELPVTALPTIEEHLTECGYQYRINGVIEAPKPAIVQTSYQFKTKPFAHQLEGFNYGLSKDKWLLADEQGLGKTKQVIDIACAFKKERGYKHCLIICGVNGLKWNWLNEIRTHSEEYGHILGMKLNGSIGTSLDKLADLQHLERIKPYFLITNIESLRYKVKTGRKIKKRGKFVDEYEYPITDELVRLCDKGDIGFIATDEVHKMKNPDSDQGEQFLRLQAQTQIAMTGTPLMNTPLDLYIILKWLGYEKHSFYLYKNHICVMGGYGGHEVLGYKNLGELQAQLDSIMLRRLKSDVFDLPEKTFVDEYVEMTPKQSVIYKEVTNEIKANIDQIKMVNDPLAELIRMRQATGYTGILSSTVQESAKLDRMEELVDEAVSNGKKVVIFSNWTQITDAIVNRLKRYGALSITGDTKDTDRPSIVQKFQTDDRYKVIVGTIGAMGTGLTLTAGTVEIFLDEPWNRALKDQAVDRCHRIGTTENVTIYTIMCKNTIDERIHTLVEKKGAMSDVLVDGKLANNVEVLNYLLS